MVSTSTKPNDSKPYSVYITGDFAIFSDGSIFLKKDIKKVSKQLPWDGFYMDEWKRIIKKIDSCGKVLAQAER